MELTVPTKPVKPAVMLPLFQRLANSFTDLATENMAKYDHHISCRKGCGACCRQPVPLAEIEIYHIAHVVEQLSEPRQSEVRKNFEHAVAHFREMGWFEEMENCEDEEEMKQIASKYFKEGVACPFLDEESCSIHNDRPVACREFLVTSPWEHCADPSVLPVAQLPLPVNASDGLRKLGRTEKLGKRNFLPLVRALEWTKQYPENFKERTGEEWLAEFFL